MNLNDALAQHGLAPTRGTVVVRYDFDTYAALGATVIASDDAHQLYLDFSGQSKEELWKGNSYDAVIWAPDRDTEGFISITNTYTSPATVQVSLTAGEHNEVHSVHIGPHQQRFVRINSLVKRSVQSGAGIHLEFDGEPGSIVAEAMLLNRRTGFAKHIHFADPALHFATPALTTHFLLLGRQPVEDGFPAEVAFRSVAAIRNIDSAPVQVVPTVSYLTDGSLHKVTLDVITLGINESKLIDFSRERRAGALPQDFTQGSLELLPNTNHTSIVGELFNFDEQTEGYVVGPSFSAHPMRSTSSIWRIDGTYETTVMIQNLAKEDDEVSVKLFSDAGTYEKIVDVAAGALVKINVKDLQQNAVPDKDGNLLTATSGMLHLSGSHGSKSTLAFDKLIHSADASEYVGLPAQPCDFVDSFTPFTTGSVSPLSAWITEFWTDGTDDTLPWGPTSGNTSLVTITGTSVNLIPVDNSSHIVDLFFTDIVLDCTACSTRDQEETSSVTVPPFDTCQNGTVHAVSSAISSQCVQSTEQASGHVVSSPTDTSFKVTSVAATKDNTITVVSGPTFADIGTYFSGPRDATLQFQTNLGGNINWSFQISCSNGETKTFTSTQTVSCPPLQ